MKFDKATQAKLQQDLKDAREAAVKALAELRTREPRDGGSCNFDSAVLRFPRVQAEKVYAVAEAIGERLYKFSDGGYHLTVPEVGWQGFYRTCQAEAQYELLKSRGWDVSMYYRMD